ncbi:hypothetical protein RIF29_14626 [Crotalaria pallida]|uniref:Uncharacterized protein n=1 Tax=Crotalaria pallida TaxID=3830 RepID=A0AAN9FHE4_CROPI
MLTMRIANVASTVPILNLQSNSVFGLSSFELLAIIELILLNLFSQSYAAPCHCIEAAKTSFVLPIFCSLFAAALLDASVALNASFCNLKQTTGYLDSVITDVCSLLRDPQYNKGLAFTEKERDAHYMRGLLPPTVSTQELQV